MVNEDEYTTTTKLSLKLKKSAVLLFDYNE